MHSVIIYSVVRDLLVALYPALQMEPLEYLQKPNTLISIDAVGASTVLNNGVKTVTQALVV